MVNYQMRAQTQNRAEICGKTGERNHKNHKVEKRNSKTEKIYERNNQRNRRKNCETVNSWILQEKNSGV